MSKFDRSLFDDTKTPRRKNPLGGKYKSYDYPLAQALAYMRAALYEVDMLLVAVLKRRDARLETVRLYKDRNGGFYRRAQKAALECDRLTAEAQALRDIKLSMWGEVASLWTKYSGSPKSGAVVAYWLCKGMTIDEIAKQLKTTRKFVVDALYKLRRTFSLLTQTRDNMPDSYKTAMIESWQRKWHQEKNDQKGEKHE